MLQLIARLLEAGNGYRLGVRVQDNLRAESLSPLLLTPAFRMAPNKVPASPEAATGTATRAHAAPRFVVQLYQSLQPIEPHEVPKLDLFDLYHLYCSSRSRDGQTQHSLCLGYFKDRGHAEAIAGYLAPHFRHPLIIQIDVAEIIASLRQKFVPGKDIGASGLHAAVVLATPPPLPARARVEAPKPATHRSVGSRSLWARLLGSLHRSQALT